MTDDGLPSTAAVLAVVGDDSEGAESHGGFHKEVGSVLVFGIFLSLKILLFLGPSDQMNGWDCCWRHWWRQKVLERILIHWRKAFRDA